GQFLAVASRPVRADAPVAGGRTGVRSGRVDSLPRPAQPFRWAGYARGRHSHGFAPRIPPGWMDEPPAGRITRRTQWNRLCCRARGVADPVRPCPGPTLGPGNRDARQPTGPAPAGTV